MSTQPTPNDDARHLAYGRLWHESARAVTFGVDEATARRASDAGREITVVASREPLTVWTGEDTPRGTTYPSWVMFLRPEDGVVVVRFHDRWGTRVSTHDFEEVDGCLFLTNALTYGFADTSQFHGEWSWTSYCERIFQPDGSWREHRTTRDAEGRQHVERTEHDGGRFDDTHWERWPAFGDWAGLASRTREPRRSP